jgi:hypothetical protein
MSLSPRCRRRGLTLFELLVLLALLVLFLGFFLAAAGGVRKAASRSQSQNNLHQITLATIDCSDAHQGKMPRGPAFWYPNDRGPENGNGHGSCLFNILPYMDQDGLFKQGRANIGGKQVYVGWAVAGKPVKTFQGPNDPTQDPKADRTSYLANGLAFPRNQGMTYPASFSDGTSQTIFFAEAYSVATDTISWGGKTQAWKTERRWWDDPTWEPVLADLPFQVAPAKDAAVSTLPQGPTPYGIMVSLGDASVRLVSGKVSATTFYAACTPNQSDVLGSDW